MAMRPLFRAIVALPLAYVLLFGPPADAGRPIEVATFFVDAGQDVDGLQVAAGSAGTMVFVWHAAGAVNAHAYSQAGIALGAPVAIGAGTLVRIAADATGGYVAAFTRLDGGTRHLFARRLDESGQPLGIEWQVDLPSDPDPVTFPHVVGVPSGSVFIWSQGSDARARLYDADGLPRGVEFLVGANSFGFPLTATALADGGFAVVWHDPSVHTFLGRRYDGNGTSLVGAVFLASSPLDIRAIAGSPTGGFAAIGIVGTSGVRVALFDDQLAVVDQVDVETLAVHDEPAPAIASDGAGNWHVAWGGPRFDATRTQIIGYQAPRARPLAADLTPLEPSFALSSVETPAVSIARVQSGSFVSAWSSGATLGSPRGYANVVSLCTPDVHVCGDGTFDARCEECDDGAGNSDVAPDACRTDCTVPACGDGVADGGEACDGGGASLCDTGCDSTCELVAGLACGDGIVVPGCQDQCDDGNAVAGDGCAPACTLERVAGGGRPATDCHVEWIVDNPTNIPLLARRGGINAKQRCVDDDPRCDFDGGVPGRCTFHVRVCANNTDVASCAPSPPLASWELKKPSIAQAARQPALALVRAAFGGVPAAIAGPPGTDVCSGVIDVVVPMRGTSAPYGPGKLTLKSVAATAAGVRDKDGLKLRCDPPS